MTLIDQVLNVIEAQMKAFGFTTFFTDTKRGEGGKVSYKIETTNGLVLSATYDANFAQAGNAYLVSLQRGNDILEELSGQEAKNVIEKIKTSKLKIDRKRLEDIRKNVRAELDAMINEALKFGTPDE